MFDCGGMACSEAGFHASIALKRTATRTHKRKNADA